MHEEGGMFHVPAETEVKQITVISVEDFLSVLHNSEI